MAISYLGVQNHPATDNANETGSTLTLDKDVAPFTTLAVDDFIVWYTLFKGAGTTTSVTTSGGQTWTEQNDSQVNSMNVSLYTCFFNGTWDADPVVTCTAAGPRIMWIVAYSGVDTTTPWDVTPVFTAQASSGTYTEATWNTATNNAVAIVATGINDNGTATIDNSFTHPSGSGNIYWRTAGGTDAGASFATKSIATAGAVGQTVTTWTLAQTGVRWHAALKPAAVTPKSALVMPLHQRVPILQT